MLPRCPVLLWPVTGRRGERGRIATPLSSQISRLYHIAAVTSIVVRHSKGPPQRGYLLGTTENVGFNAKVQRNLGLDLVTKQHKSLQKHQPVYSLA